MSSGTAGCICGDWSEIEDCTEALYWLANELARHGDAARCDHPDLPPRVAAALQVDAAFKHLWATGKHDGPDTSRSGSDCALANALHRLGCDFGEFSTALQAWHHGQDRPLPERRPQRLWDLVSGVSPYGEADVPPSEPIDAGSPGRC